MHGIGLLLPAIVLAFGTALGAAAQHVPDHAGVPGAAADAGKSGSQLAEYGRDLITNGTELFIGEPSSRSGRGNVHHYVLASDSGEWVLESSWTPPDNAEGRRFGHALDVDGDWLAVGAPAPGGTGAVYVYRASDEGSWDHHSTLTVTEEIGDRFGSAVAVSGNRIAAGAIGADAGAGVVFVFAMDEESGVWESSGSISGPTAAQSRFGNTLAFGSDVLAVGASSEDNLNGAVYILEQDFLGWSVSQRIARPPGNYPLLFGAALDISGDSLFIGANGYQAGGTVYLYTRWEVGGPWQEIQQIGGGEFNENFGIALSYQDPLLVVGGVGFNDSSGRISVYRKNEFAWSLKDTFVSSRAGDNFGRHVDFSGGVVAATTVNGDNGDGSVRIFSLDPVSGALSEQGVVASPIEGFEAVTGARASCSDGLAAGFQCRNVDLMSFIPIDDMGGPGRLNDVWGWTDTGTGREFALAGRNDGTAFVEITSPMNPQYLGLLPTHMEDGATRDIKVYKDHAFIVADGAGFHGMQVFDLTELLSPPGQNMAADARYDAVASVHNIAINEETGRAFLVGDRQSETGCSGGIHIVDIRDPLDPEFENCARDTETGTGSGGYTHDLQCIVYDGPDSRYTGREICVGSNTTHVSIFDVSRGSQPEIVGRGTYPDAGYIHQGWFTDGRRYFYQNDEADEFAQGRRTRTLIWDMQDLEDPVLVAEYEAETFTTDHNLYILGDVMVQANYGSGLRIVDISERDAPVETGFFDTAPSDYGGAWTAYPYFPSGNIVVSSIAEGLFVLRGTGAAAVSLEEGETVPASFNLEAAFPNPTYRRSTIGLTLDRPGRVRILVFDALGREAAAPVDRTYGVGRHEIDVDLDGGASGVYFIVAESSAGTDVRPIVLNR